MNNKYSEGTAELNAKISKDPSIIKVANYMLNMDEVDKELALKLVQAVYEANKGETNE
jgi:hypothetical protein